MALTPRISAAFCKNMRATASGDLSDPPRVRSSWGSSRTKVTLSGQGGGTCLDTKVVRPTLSSFRMTSRHRQRQPASEFVGLGMVASIVQEMDMSNPALPAPEAITFIRAQLIRSPIPASGAHCLGRSWLWVWMLLHTPGQRSMTSVMTAQPLVLRQPLRTCGTRRIARHPTMALAILRRARDSLAPSPAPIQPSH